MLDAASGRVSLVADTLDFDNADAHLAAFCQLIGATAKEKQTDADLLSWLVDFEGVGFMLRAEHYSACVWLEKLGEEGDEELQFLYTWLARQLAE